MPTLLRTACQRDSRRWDGLRPWRAGPGLRVSPGGSAGLADRGGHARAALHTASGEPTDAVVRGRRVPAPENAVRARIGGRFLRLFADHGRRGPDERDTPSRMRARP